MKFLITRHARDIGLLIFMIAVSSAATAADPQCITGVQFQSLTERTESLAPHADKTRIYADFVTSSRLLSERLARVKDCQQEATYLDNIFNSCRSVVLEYNSQVEEHKAILRRRETAKILQADFIEMKKLLALQRCSADQGNKQPWHPSPEKILREYRNLPLALRLYFEKRDIRVSSKPAEKLEDGVVVTLEGDVSEGVLEKALEQFLIALNNAPMGSPDPICYGAEAI